MTWRILLAYPGGECTLTRYRKPMPIQDVTRKAASHASELFPSWRWAEDGEIPAIETEGPAMILCVLGHSGAEVTL
jgi:hypothetical protein